MCDIETSRLIADFRKEAAKFKPTSVVNWNGTSWDYMSIALMADVPEQDRMDMAKFARKALCAAAVFDQGIKSLAFVVKDPVKVMASLKLPPEPGPTADTHRVDFGKKLGGAANVRMVPQDTHRVQRRRAITAAVLLRLEKNRAWRPAPGEFEEIARRAGARVV